MTVTLIAATSLDGFIAQDQDQSSFDWTSPADKAFYVAQLKKSDAIIMGRKTFATFSRYPKNSRWIIYSSSPENFTNPKPDLIQAEATNEKPQDLLKRLASQNCKNILIAGGASVYTQFVEAGLVDKIFLTVESVIFGKGISLFTHQLDQPKPKHRLTLTTNRIIGTNTLLLEYHLSPKHNI